MSAAQKSREIRFGIVMYGGVSLAIYINGVSQELFRAVQGEGIYKVLKKCFDTDIVVDIISGTSAGGINGLLLAYALANNKKFTSTKDLWRQDGDISQLLYGANAEPETCKSLLNSDEYYRSRLAAAFRAIDAKDYIATVDEEVSPTDEMDVFITGTSFEPDLYTIFDDKGRPIEMRDYRKVFRLKHRPRRLDRGAFLPLEGEDQKDVEVRFQALAKLARITSCFPGAFLPVRVLQASDWEKASMSNLPFAREPEVDKSLVEWGALKESAYFLDGGVLDNKPFTPTIAAIFGRTTDRPVDRILFYVEPDPEITPTADQCPCEPNFVSAVLNGVVGISTYQSTTDDARTLEEHNTQVVRHTAVCGELKGKLGSARNTGVGIPAILADPQKTLYISARNTALASKALRGVLRNNKTGAEPHLTSAADRERVKKLFHSLNADRGSNELTYNQTFERYDIYFRQRRLHHAVKWLYLSLSEKTESDATAMRSLLQGLNQHIQLLEIVQYWFEYALDRIPVDWKTATATSDPWSEIWGQVSVFLKDALRIGPEDAKWLPPEPRGGPEWLSTQQLDVVNSALHARVTQLLQLGKTPPRADENFESILQWIDAAEQSFFKARNDGSEIFQKAKSEYDFFVDLDAVVFPLDFLSNLTSLNEVRLLRISPAPTLNDRNEGVIGFKANSGAEDKLAGRLLGHFSGFLKRSWRSNDILWGRLDGLRHIVLVLLTEERVRMLRSDDGLRSKILQSLGGQAGLFTIVERAFKQSPSISHREIADYFASILSPEPFNFDANELEAKTGLLVEMGQLEIIAEEVPVVLEDAAWQQAEWNRFGKLKENSRSAADPPTFIAPAGYMDPSLIGLHIKTELQQASDAWSRSIASATGPKSTGLGAYFERDYDVAGEGLEKGIPPLVLAEYLTRISLVLNACLLGSLPASLRTRVAGGWVYKRALRMPLRISHRIVKLWLREPKMSAVMLTSALAASTVAIGLVLYFYLEHHLNQFPGGGERFLLVLVPLLFLVLSFWILLRRTKLGL